MRRYETIIIIDPDLSDEGRAPVLDRVTELIPQFDGTLILTDDWGAKKLAYEIKKKTRGYYVRMDFCGSGALISEIERNFRIDDRVLKFMTVLLDKDVDPEKILADIAKEEAAKAESLKAAATPAAEPPAEDKAIDTPAAEPPAEDKAIDTPEAEAPAENKAGDTPEAEAPVKDIANDTPEPEVSEETKAPETSEEA